jgi:hypothetical protein
MNIIKASVVRGAAYLVLVGAALSCNQSSSDDIYPVDSPTTPPVARTKEVVPTPPTPPAADQPAPALQPEFLAAPASPAAVAGEQSARDQLRPLAGAVPGGRVQFIDCANGPCVARVNARTLQGLRDLLASISQSVAGGIGFVVREQFDPYRGHFYQADVTMNGGNAATVPDSAAELLVNFGDPPDTSAP